MGSKFKYHKDGSKPDSDDIFCFGSNLSGIHGAGAARAAYDNYGAKFGVGIGFFGDSYEIPTKDFVIDSMDISIIRHHVEIFKKITHTCSDMKFFVTRIGCQLAGYSNADIAPMFKGCNPDNCSFAEEWQEYLEG